MRSMHTDAFNHHPGQLLLFSGSIQFGRPTMGAWVIYGLGSESQNLPGFVVLSSGVGTSGGASNWSAAFCRPPTRASSSAAPATRCCICRTRRASRSDMQRAGLDA